MPRTSSDKPSLDAISILIEDHKQVTEMFSEFRKLNAAEEEDDEKKQSLVERTCTALTIHSQVEEEIFYPALRDAMIDPALLDEAEVEHEIASQLIMDLESMQPGDDLYDAKFTVLGEYVRHHIEEEQEKLFPRAKRAQMDLAALGKDIRERKEELRIEFDVPEEDDAAVRGEIKSKQKRHGRNADI